MKYALDNDLYKFTMQKAVFHHYPGAWVKYRFKLRNPHIMDGIDLDYFYDLFQNRVRELCQVRFQDDELDYLSNIPFLNEGGYIDFLEDFTFKSRYLNIKRAPDGINLSIEGPWLQTILFEVPLLNCFTSSYHITRRDKDEMLWHSNVLEKIEYLIKYLFPGNNYVLVEFGTRRRSAYEIQKRVIEILIKYLPNTFIGTSNVHFAKMFNIKPIGTMAHEWLQAHQALHRVIDSQKMALETWAKEYRGDLGIALSDVVGFDAFLRDFDKYFSKLFDGCRHDSGDPIEWGEKLIKHYKMMDIDPMTKHAVFSDGLDFEKMVKIYRHFDGQINTSFGIGTYLSNDCGYQAPQVVIKMIECNGKPVAKISDSKGKGMCENESYLKYLKEQFKNV